MGMCVCACVVEFMDIRRARTCVCVCVCVGEFMDIRKARRNMSPLGV